MKDFRFTPLSRGDSGNALAVAGFNMQNQATDPLNELFDRLRTSSESNYDNKVEHNTGIAQQAIMDGNPLSKNQIKELGPINRAALVEAQQEKEKSILENMAMEARISQTQAQEARYGVQNDLTRLQMANANMTDQQIHDAKNKAGLASSTSDMARAIMDNRSREKVAKIRASAAKNSKSKSKGGSSGKYDTDLERIITEKDIGNERDNIYRLKKRAEEAGIDPRLVGQYLSGSGTNTDYIPGGDNELERTGILNSSIWNDSGDYEGAEENFSNWMEKVSPKDAVKFNRPIL